MTNRVLRVVILSAIYLYSSICYYSLCLPSSLSWKIKFVFNHRDKCFGIDKISLSLQLHTFYSFITTIFLPVKVSVVHVFYFYMLMGLISVLLYLMLFVPSEKSSLQSGVRKWYFFCAREKKYASGGRKNRSTKCGFWKTTGIDRKVHYDGRVVGMIKTLVFHKGRAPNGDRTNWVMYEYRLQDSDLASKGVDQVFSF